ncbi:TPA: hypothetical protein EYP38_00635 [Candidatus Micrarchaeota archaeon]|nr:hypothetical protein [Candidatus Micrarchaeota archaeon]
MEYSRILVFTLGLMLITTGALAQGALEVPAADGRVSGIGIVSGWHCDAERIEIVFDDRPPKEAAYGTSRRDTVRVCGDADNGFGMLFAWSLLGPGKHRVRVFADGKQFASRQFTVGQIGNGRRILDYDPAVYVLDDFPDVHTEVLVSWDEAQQNFVVLESRNNATEEDYSVWDGLWRFDNDAATVSIVTGLRGNAPYLWMFVMFDRHSEAAERVGADYYSLSGYITDRDVILKREDYEPDAQYLLTLRDPGLIEYEVKYCSPVPPETPEGDPFECHLEKGQSGELRRSF